MRPVRTLTLLLVLAAGSSAKAAEVTTAQSASAPAKPADSLPWLGLQTDVGVPDGAQGALVLRPWKALRFTVGGGYNMISKGVRAGLSILPFGRGPSLSVEAGRFFEGDGNAAARKVMSSFQDVAI